MLIVCKVLIYHGSALDVDVIDLLFKKQKNAINVITRDIDIRSRFFGSGWGIYIEFYGNNACFLTLRSELYHSIIYLNGTSMNIEQKTFVQQVQPPL